MGALTSRQRAGVEEVDIISNHAYKYPPRTGNYFGSHFIMGGERFDTPQPESYLFGENADLNFLGSRPTPFPYPPPQANEPTKTLKSLVNIRKESLRFIRAPDSLCKSNEGDIESTKATQFNIEFTFDCDARCAITIYYFCTEEVTASGVTYTPRDPTMNSETFHYKRGASQQFSQISHVFDPSSYTDDELLYNPENDVFPIVIHCVAEEGEEPRQSHATIAVVDHHSDGTFVLKALKQKLYVDGLCYLLQEIYGIENKNNDNSKGNGDEETEDNGSECVICMCDVRDTLILPCRHLCLCNSCADSLRYQANNCPICRAPFRALLQIRALQKSSSIPQLANLPPEGSSENIPAGYEAVSLIEALNGPSPLRPVAPIHPLDIAETPDEDDAVEAAEILNRPNIERIQSSKQNSSEGNISPDKTCDTCTTPEFHMSVLLPRGESNHREHKMSPLLVRHSRLQMKEKGTTKPRDTVRLVNEKKPMEQEETGQNCNVYCNTDDDSEAEKLSPLLVPVSSPLPHPLMVERSMDHLEIVEDDDDDDDDDDEEEEEEEDNEDNTDDVKRPDAVGDKEIKSESQRIPNGPSVSAEMDSCLVVNPGDDSDYYTPEDPATTILSPLHSEKESNLVSSSVESTPGRWVGMSLPGTPLSTTSHLSNRSSGDSYSSSSSTRQLLSVVNNNTADKIIQL